MSSPLRRGFGEGDIPRGVTDRILLRTAPDESNGQIVHGWAGTWPPPPTLVRIVDRWALPDGMAGTGQARVVDPTEQEPGLLDQFRAHPKFIVQTYLLNTASKLPEPARPGDSWFRGAEYLLVTDDPARATGLRYLN